MSRPRHIRLFLSSPGDVTAERAIVLSVLDQLPYDPLLRGKISLEVVAWDKPGADTPMLATLTPQEAINRGLPLPSQCDIVVVIFWSRMGTPLPEKYTKPDGSRYLSGTEWEYLDAYKTASTEGTPLLIVYRRSEKVLLDPSATDFKSKYEQWQRVEDFFDDFVNADGSIEHGYNPYPTPDEFRAKFETHIRVLVSQLLDAPERDIPLPDHKGDEVIKIVEEQWQGSPFPGLRAFKESEAPIYFGRGRETDALVRQVAASRFVAVFGASGSGKSSLVAAGLIPRLRANAVSGDQLGSKDWQVVSFTPGKGENPFEALYNGLIESLPALRPNPLEARRVKLNFIADMREAPATILDVCDAALVGQPDWAEILFFIDQFEELFTLVPDATLRAQFVEMLKVLQNSPRARVVVTMRSDFYHRCVDVPDLAELLQAGIFSLSVPKRDALKEMIIRPAERAHLAFENYLVDRILDDTGDDPGALALLAYALDELYKIARNGVIKWADYTAIGGVQGAIGRRADATFNTLTLDNPDLLLQQVFHELIEVDERGVATRRRVLLSQLDEATQPLVQAFIRARLLVTDEDAQRQPTLEVAHEALLRNWGRLADWIEATQDDRRLIRRIEREAHLWAERGYLDYMLPNAEEIREFQQACGRLNVKTTHETVLAFTEPEQNRLLRELELIDTPHHRRAWIGERLASIGDTRPGVGINSDGLPDIEWCYIEGGEITLTIESGGSRFGGGGTSRMEIGHKEKEGSYTFTVEPFYISKYLVTLAQFQVFVDDPDGFNNDLWWQGLHQDGFKQAIETPRMAFANSPRDSVSWYQAMAFTRWLNTKLPQEKGVIRLPTEWEWQWAASGGNPDFEYPWGRNWDGRLAITTEVGLGRSMLVGMYPAGIAQCGAFDMAGNLWEWCLNEYNDIKSININSKEYKPLRGGSWLGNSSDARVVYRDYNVPDHNWNHSGFRVVCASPIALPSE